MRRWFSALAIQAAFNVKVRAVAAALVFAQFLTTSVAEGQQLRDPCDIKLEGAFAGPHFSYVKPANFETLPSEAAAYAAMPRRASSATVMAIPLTRSDFRSVFGTHVMSAADDHEVDKAKALFWDSTPTATTAISTRRDFARFLKAERSAYVIVAGHNIDGKLRLRSEEVPLPLLAIDCAAAAKVCIFISCKSNDYLTDGSVGVSRDLTLAEGVYLAKHLTEWLAHSRLPVTELEIAAHVRRLQLNAFLKYHVSYFALGACKVAGTVVVMFLLVEGFECATDPKRCPAKQTRRGT